MRTTATRLLIRLLAADLSLDEIDWTQDLSLPRDDDMFMGAGSAQPQSVFAIDLDKDGDVDVIAALAQNNTIAWYENVLVSGVMNFTRNVLTDNASRASYVEALDMDNDGDIDILYCGAGTPSEIAWFWNEKVEKGLADGVAEFTKVSVVQTISSVSDQFRMVKGVDMDDDGDIDIVFAGILCPILCFLNTNLLPYMCLLIPYRIPHTTYPTAFATDEVGFYKNDGNMTFVKNIVASDRDGITSIDTYDVNGDGSMDILSSS
jgi:hypothetical protein